VKAKRVNSSCAFIQPCFVLIITAWVSKVRERMERIKHHKTIFFHFHFILLE